jgi:parvulin-like peptidyl-prolyl isomerase
MKAKVWRVVAPLIFLIFAAAFYVVAQQSKSNPVAQGSDHQAGGSPPSLTPTPATDRTVLKVGARTVTQAEVETLIRNMDQQSQKALTQQGLRSLGDQYALMLVLTQEATRKHLDESADFRREMAAQQERMLAQAEFRSLDQDVKVTPEETSQYYASHGADFDQVQVRQFAVRTKPQNAKEGTPGLTVEEGRARLENIKKTLVSGTDPKQVAKDFGVPNQVLLDPEPRVVRQSALLPEFQKAAFKLKDGEFTDIQQVGDALVALQVVGHGHIELKDASQEIQNTLHKQKLDAEITALKKKSNIWIDESYFRASSTPAPGANPAAPQSNPSAKP